MLGVSRRDSRSANGIEVEEEQAATRYIRVLGRRPHLCEACRAPRIQGLVDRVERSVPLDHLPLVPDKPPEYCANERTRRTSNHTSGEQAAKHTDRDVLGLDQLLLLT